ncbi:HlyD family secretion protein [Pseudomonas fluorescens]|uniref:Putative multidrug resistance protein EmrK n=1 Tax=Pseudomonas fluorescens TaxID=294 RepID=A0A5E7C6Q0_PSEFL|nr:HlyD family secretion protein [Pseudomonas fluorescens]VVN98077.1 putative multidrug resistance protein EmrK [Pseudomonas fluorescens]
MSETTLDRVETKADSGRGGQHTEPTMAHAAAPVAPQPIIDQAPRSSRGRTALFLLLPAILLGIGWAFLAGGRYISTDSAYIQAERVGGATDVSGLVNSVEVQDNQQVSKGQVLFRLRPAAFETALSSTRAELGTVRNELMNLKASYDLAQAKVAQAQAELPYRQENLRRLEQLLKVSAVSKNNYDDSRHEMDSNLQRVAVAKAKAKAKAQAVLAQLGGQAGLPVDRYPTYQKAQAAVADAERMLADSVVRAPFDGIVTQVDSLQVGSYLQASQAGVSLISSDRQWVAASPKETELTHVVAGQPVKITVDSYPGQVWHGVVESLSPASGASFALLPAQNTTGNWVKVVQRIPIRIRIDDTVGKPVLRHGMSVEAEIDTGRSRGLPEGVTQLFAGKASGRE